MRGFVSSFIAVLAVVLTGCQNSKEDETLLWLERSLGIEDITSEKHLSYLEECLELQGGNTKKYAAAQALYIMNTEKSKALLDAFVMDFERFNILDAIHNCRIGNHHGGDILRDYYLRPRSDELAIVVKATQPNGPEGGIQFELILTNSAEKTIRVDRIDRYEAALIIFVSDSGEVSRFQTTTKYKLGPVSPAERFVAIEPGGSHTINFKGSPKLRSKLQNEKTDNEFVLGFSDAEHVLPGKGGHFKVYCCYRQPLSGQVFDDIWVGQVASEPVEIVLEPRNEE